MLRRQLFGVALLKRSLYAALSATFSATRSAKLRLL
jgi:hypothetical protein